MWLRGGDVLLRGAQPLNREHTGSAHPFTEALFVLDGNNEESPGRRLRNEGQWFESGHSESLRKPKQLWPTPAQVSFGAAWSSREKGRV